MSSRITVSCPSCQAQLRLKSRAALGTRRNCPRCAEPFVLRADGESSSATRTPSGAQHPSRRRKNRRKTQPRIALILGGVAAALGLCAGVYFLLNQSGNSQAGEPQASALQNNDLPANSATDTGGRGTAPQPEGTKPGLEPVGRQAGGVPKQNPSVAAVSPDGAGRSQIVGSTRPKQPAPQSRVAENRTAIAGNSAPRRAPRSNSPSSQSPDSGKNWPRFRGPGGAGHSSATGLPQTWSAQNNIAWKLALPGPGSSSPVIWGDRVYVTCYTGYGLDVSSPGQKSNLQRHLFCVNRSDGRVVWKKSKPLSGDIAAYSSPHTIGKHGYATSTPVVDESGVYVFYGADGVIAYTHSGDQRWQASCGSKVNDYGSATSPILYGDLLVVHAGVQCGALLAFNKNTGQEVWRIKGLLSSFWTPLVVKSNGRDELLYSGNYDYQVGAVDPRTGAKLWNCKTNVGTINGSPVADGDVVFLLGKNNKSAAMRTGGSGNVSASHKVWEAGKGAYITSPIYYNGHVYWSRDGGVVYCLDAKTGRVVYEKRIQGYVYASPVIADGKLYYVTRERGVLVLPAGPEFRILAHNTIDTDKSVFNGSPAISGRQIFLRSNKFLYCIGTQ